MDTQEELYFKINENWPTLDIIKKNRIPLKNINIVSNLLRRYVQIAHISAFTLYHQRLCVLCSAELIKTNVGICYGTHLDSVVEVISKKLETIPELTRYNEDFKKKCLMGYLDNLKHQARKKLIMFYMIHCEGLCYDVVEHLMTFY
jgi:hypothetical protein